MALIALDVEVVQVSLVARTAARAADAIEFPARPALRAPQGLVAAVARAALAHTRERRVAAACGAVHLMVVKHLRLLASAGHRFGRTLELPTKRERREQLAHLRLKLGHTAVHQLLGECGQILHRLLACQGNIACSNGVIPIDARKRSSHLVVEPAQLGSAGDDRGDSASKRFGVDFHRGVREHGNLRLRKRGHALRRRRFIARSSLPRRVGAIERCPQAHEEIDARDFDLIERFPIMLRRKLGSLVVHVHAFLVDRICLPRPNPSV